MCRRGTQPKHQRSNIRTLPNGCAARRGGNMTPSDPERETRSATIAAVLGEILCASRGLGGATLTWKEYALAYSRPSGVNATTPPTEFRATQRGPSESGLSEFLSRAGGLPVAALDLIAPCCPSESEQLDLRLVSSPQARIESSAFSTSKTHRLPRSTSDIPRRSLANESARH